MISEVPIEVQQSYKLKFLAWIQLYQQNLSLISTKFSKPVDLKLENRNQACKWKCKNQRWQN